MKQILFFTILICSNPCLSQIERSLNAVVQKGIYIYNNQKDTIYLSDMNVGLFCKCKDLQIVDSIQIDGVGSKEIVFLRNCRGENDEQGGTFVRSGYNKVSKYEIWNLDTKQLIFEATNYYKSKFDRNNLGSNRIKGVESWSYDFRIDDAGTITISKLKTSTKAKKFIIDKKKSSIKNKVMYKKTPYNFDVRPDKTEGTYRYVDGKYSRE
jgi:hypothetical protein